MLSKKTKIRLFLILIGIGIFIVCFVLLFVIGNSSLPETSNELLIKEYNWSFLPVGGDSIIIKNDLVFFWPLIFTNNYYSEDGEYAWGYTECLPFSCYPSHHPLILLYWVFVSAIISLLVLSVVRILLKRGIKRNSLNKTLR